MKTCLSHTADYGEEDQKIINKIIKEGDKNSFEIIVDRYKKPVMTLVFRMTGDYEASSDIAQETFLKAWKYLKSYKQEMKFSSWIFKIATNIARDYNANCSKRKEESLEIENIDNQLYEIPKESLYIQSSLNKLNEPYRSALIMRFMKELTYAEIGEVLNVSGEQVKNYIFRGRKELLKIIREEDKDELSI